MSEDRLMIRSQEEWWEWSFVRGTSGDMVIDILEDWKKERKTLLSSLEGANKEIERLKGEKTSDCPYCGERISGRVPESYNY